MIKWAKFTRPSWTKDDKGFFYSRYPESPSPRVYGEGSAQAGLAAYEAHLGKAFDALADRDDKLLAKYSSMDVARRSSSVPFSSTPFFRSSPVSLARPMPLIKRLRIWILW